MSILSAIRQQSGSIDDLAKLPQAMIMQMAQRKQISTEMVAPILARKAEMIDAAAKSKAMQGGVPKTSVMEQIIAQNSAAEQPQQMPTMENSGVAQLPVPEREYAGGGIIAFAKGSMIDLDDDDEIDASDDYAKAAAMVQRANAMPVSMSTAKPSIFSQSYESALANESQPSAFVPKSTAGTDKKNNAVMPNVSKRGGHKYEDMVIKEAQRVGLDPSIAVHALYKETGNLKNPETAKSSAGAIGVMQLMPRTAKELGVDPSIPEENVRGGVTYLKQMYDKYQDPTLALAAYNAGPGRLDKALKSGQGIAGLSRETQNYVIANRMASGGEVKHFQYGGSTMGGFELDGSSSDDSLMSPEYQKYFKEYQKELEKRMKSKKDLPSSLQAPPLKTEPPATTNKISRDFDTTSEEIPSAAKTVAATPAVAPKTAFEMFIEQNDLDRAALGKQRSEDRNMALLAAGLGMLGGESPYAFTNIGKGGLSGVSYLSEANKQRAAQQAALDKNRVAAMHYGNVGDYYKSQVLDKEERQKLGQQKLEETAFQNATRYKDMMMNRLKAEGFDSTLIALLPANDPQRKAFNQRLLEIENDPYYLAQLRKAGMPLKEQSTAPVSTKDFKLVK
jgi:hypothetical protein